MKTVLFLVFLLTSIQCAHSANFCVSSSAELVDALSNANSNNQNDEIRILKGDYMTINNNPFSFINLEDFDLTISGGWSNINQLNCISQFGKPEETTLDGDDLSQVLYLQDDNSFSSNITVQNLTIVNGFSDTFNRSGGLTIYTAAQFTGKILIDRVFFLANAGPNGVGSALHVLNGNESTVRNSVFMFNNTNNGHGSVKFSLAANQYGVYFINNTLIYNDTNSEDGSAFNSSGLNMNLNYDNGLTPSSLIANNLFWYNENSDFFVSFSGGQTYVFNNDYERGSGLIEDSANNISMPPQLDPLLFNFTPQNNSPLLDQGLQMPETIPIPTPFLLGWDHGFMDFDQGLIQRVHNDYVDIGAVESPFEGFIFRDDFEQ